MAPQVIELTSDGGQWLRKKCQETGFSLACHLPLPHLLPASAFLNLGGEAQTCE